MFDRARQIGNHMASTKYTAAFPCWHGPRGSFAAIAALLVAAMGPPFRFRAPCAHRKILRDHPCPFMNNSGWQPVGHAFPASNASPGERALGGSPAANAGCQAVAVDARRLPDGVNRLAQDSAHS